MELRPTLQLRQRVNSQGLSVDDVKSVLALNVQAVDSQRCLLAVAASGWLQEASASDSCPIAAILCNQELDIAVHFQLS